MLNPLQWGIFTGGEFFGETDENLSFIPRAGNVSPVDGIISSSIFCLFFVLQEGDFDSRLGRIRRG